MPSPPLIDQVLTLSSARQVVVLATGGTIAGVADSPHAASYRAAQLRIDELVGAVPPLAEAARADGLVYEQVAQLDSKDMDWPVWRTLAERVALHLARPEVAGIVVTHGTDTLEETAYLLHRVLPAAKPVVLTAAMRPATALDADGPGNLLNAVSVAAMPDVHGVLAVLAGAVWSGAELRKAHSWKVDAFDAGDAGPLALLHPSRGLQQLRAWPWGDGSGNGAWPAALLQDGRPWVEVMHSHAAAEPRGVDALIQAGVQGLVVACTGGGTVHADLDSALQRALAAGVPVWRSTRVARGGVSASMGQDGSSAGIPSAGTLTPAQARIELMLSILAQRRGLPAPH